MKELIEDAGYWDSPTQCLVAIKFGMNNEGEIDRDNRWCSFNNALEATGDGK